MIGFELIPKFNMGMFCCVHLNNTPHLHFKMVLVRNLDENRLNDK
jgi:hypothetical protein